MTTKQQILTLLGVVLIAASAGTGMGFGGDGHRIICTIAEANLTTRARERVNEILVDRSMADVCMWADEERRNDRSTSTWHYIDYSIVDGKLNRDAATSGTILDAISSQSKILVTSPVANQRNRALKFIVHFTADLHQPLHCSDNNDAGGNRVRVRVLERDINLHSAWDGLLPEHMLKDELTSAPLETVALDVAKEFQLQKDALSAGTISDWSLESCQAAREVAYKFGPRDEAGQIVILDDAYVARAGKTLRRQFAAAGFRLARLLNDLLDPPAAR
jgi:hypothetical protein